MATFKKGQSMKQVRVHAASQYPQKGPGMTGVNMAFSMSNDLLEPSEAFTGPMLEYGTFVDKNGEKKPTYTTAYSASQAEKFEAAANKDGDAMVVLADVFPNKKGTGLIVNMDTLTTPDEPFNAAAHKENTMKARELKKEARAAKESGQEQEQEESLEA